MGILDLFKRYLGKSSPTKRSPATVIEQALSSKGIRASEVEIEEVMERLSHSIKMKMSLPEAMYLSRSAELEYDGLGYTISASLLLSDGSGKVPQDLLNVIISLAIYYASASEIVAVKGFPEFTLKPGQKIALCDFTGIPGGGHPLHGCFPELLNKTVMSSRRF